MTTIERSPSALGVAAGALLKAFPVVARRRRDEAGDGARRPSRQRDQAAQRARQRLPAGAPPTRSRRGSARPGSSGRSAPRCRSCSTQGVAPGGYVTGANRARRAPARRRARAATSRSSGSTCARWSPATRSTAPRSGSSRRSRWATSSSSARATRSRWAPPTWTRPASEQLIWMGCYGFGPARAAAAAVEQYADEHGISWPRAIAPFDVELVALGKAGQRGARARRPALRRAARSSASTSSTTTATPARARSSPTPSCSAARCGSPSGAARSARARSRCRSGAGARRRTRAARGRRGGDRRALARAALRPAARGEPARERRSPSGGCSGIDRSGPPPEATLSGQPLQPVDDPERDRLSSGLPASRCS